MPLALRFWYGKLVTLVYNIVKMQDEYSRFDSKLDFSMTMWLNKGVFSFS